MRADLNKQADRDGSGRRWNTDASSARDFGVYGRGDELDYAYDRGYYSGVYRHDDGFLGNRAYLYGAARGPAPRGDLGRTPDGQYPSARDRYFNGAGRDLVGYEMYGNPDLVQRSHGNSYGTSPGMGGATGEYLARRGEHFGKGPRNYRPDDQRILEDVCDELTWHHDLDASAMEVQVENGEVTLAGVAPDRSHKRLAEDLALAVRGVRDVHNRLRSSGPGSRPGVRE